MSYVPIARTVPQYMDRNGDPYSGAVLKAYLSGTSESQSFSLDDNGTALVSHITLNASGYPEVSENVVIPRLNNTYKLALYPTKAAADSNSGAIWIQDNIQTTYQTLGGEELENIADGTARTSAISVGQVQDGELQYLGTTGGSADAYTLSPTPTISEYISTMSFRCKIHATNTTTTPYIQFNTISNPSSTAVLKKLSEAKSEIALEVGDLVSNGIYEFQRNSANDAWILINEDIVLASDAETIAQSSTSKLITPSNLAALKASNAEVITGTDSTKYVSPASLTNYNNTKFSSSKNTPGWTYLVNDFILQWGYVNVNSTVDFPKPFPNAVLSLTFGAYGTGSGLPRATSFNTSSFVYNSANFANDAAYWQAIGH